MTEETWGRARNELLKTVGKNNFTTWIEPLLRESDRAGILALIPPGSPHVWQTFRPELAVDAALRRTA